MLASHIELCDMGHVVYGINLMSISCSLNLYGVTNTKVFLIHYKICHIGHLNELI
jgi:hypothetical protein